MFKNEYIDEEMYEEKIDELRKSIEKISADFKEKLISTRSLHSIRYKRPSRDMENLYVTERRGLAMFNMLCVQSDDVEQEVEDIVDEFRDEEELELLDLTERSKTVMPGSSPFSTL